MNTINLTFNDDGTIDPEQLVGLDPDFVARITSPEFVAQAKKQIGIQKAKDDLARMTELRKRQTGRREIKRNDPLMCQRADGQHTVSPIRRPKGLSGRQRKRLNRQLRKAAKAQLPPSQQ